jgi:hypothetical protein
LFQSTWRHAFPFHYGSIETKTEAIPSIIPQPTRFPFHNGSIETWLDAEVFAFADALKFPFHYGSIETPKLIFWYGVTMAHFHSTMVRLRLPPQRQETGANREFPFHYGSIETYIYGKNGNNGKN